MLDVGIIRGYRHEIKQLIKEEKSDNEISKILEIPSTSVYYVRWKTVCQDKLPASSEFLTFADKFDGFEELSNKERAEIFNDIKNNIYVKTLEFLSTAPYPMKSNRITRSVEGLTSAKLVNLNAWNFICRDEFRRYSLAERGYVLCAFMYLEGFF